MALTQSYRPESQDRSKDAESFERLTPYQVCFVVDDVEGAAAECRERFGWGPFRSFQATVDSLEYKGRPARRVAEVALGMAGRVQVELLHVHEGVDCLAAYQARYGCGFQHLGIDTPSRDASLARLEALGAQLDHLDEYEGIRIAFVDVPSGALGAFELVDRTSGAEGAEDAGSGAGGTPPEPGPTPRVAIDRATLVTDRMTETCDFFAKAFGWPAVAAEDATLRWEDDETSLRRVLGSAGRLEIEIVEGRSDARDPYSRHLSRKGPGLVHAGGRLIEVDPSTSFAYHWLETDERFALLDWSGGPSALQLRMH